MDTRKIFQYILMGVGGFLLLVAVGLFATYKPGQVAEEQGTKANLVMWGALPSTIMTPIVGSVKNLYPELAISYKYIPDAEFDAKFTEALAAGVGPDLILLDDQHMLQYRSRLQTISFEQYPESAYRTEFVSAAGSLLLPWGIVAFPIGVDPLVLYSNRDLLAGAYLAEPAKTWSEVLDQVKTFTTSDENGKVSMATIPLGVYANVQHASDIIWMLSFQSGNPLARYMGGKFISTVRGIPGADASSDSSIARSLEFFTAFARPNSEAYNWNPAFTDSRTAFMAEESVYYIGRASEYNEIRTKNPNLNIGISMVPQISMDITAKKRTSGRVYGVAMTKLSAKKTAAFVAMRTLSSEVIATALQNAGLAPARIASVSVRQSDPRLDVIYKSSLIMQTWWNPDREQIDALLSKALQSLQAQTAGAYDVVNRLDNELQNRYRMIVPPQTESQ